MNRQTQRELFAAAPVEPVRLPDGAQWRTVTTPYQPLGCVLKRSRRRSISFIVDDTGLNVTAPSWVTLKQIDDAVVSRSRWIVEKLRHRENRLEELAAARELWAQHGQIPYMGRHITLKFCDVKKTARFSGQARAPQKGDTLCLPLAQNASNEQIESSVHAWLQRQTRWWLGLRLEHFLALSGQSLKGWRLSSATTRWGACSSAGRITLNWRLIHFRHELIDYVVAHEVAHLREMNHSAAFWREVERLLPGYESARQELRRHRPDTLPLI